MPFEAIPFLLLWGTVFGLAPGVFAWRTGSRTMWLLTAWLVAFPLVAVAGLEGKARPSLMLTATCLVVLAATVAHGRRLYAGRKHAFWGLAPALVLAVWPTVRYLQSVRHWAEGYEEIAAAYPVEDISDRLPPAPSATVSPDYDEEQLQVLEWAVADNDTFPEEQSMWEVRNREMTLHKVHRQAVSQFVNADEFGMHRGVRPTRDLEDLAVPEPPALPVDGDPGTEVAGPPDESLAEEPGAAEPAAALFADVADFSNPAGFGVTIDDRGVAGFQPHGFRKPSRLAESLADRWRLERLQLFSLLLHDPPMVYDSRVMPNMHELSLEGDTRPPDRFEGDALAKLQGGEDLVQQETADRLRVVGSIRAVRQCTGCHAVAQGTLLGAFSYAFRRRGAAPAEGKPRS